MQISRFKYTPNSYKQMFLHIYLLYTLLFLILFCSVTALVLYQSEQNRQEDTSQAAAALAHYTNEQLGTCQKLSVSVGRNEKLLNLYSDTTTDLDFSLLDSTTLFSVQHDLVTARALNHNVANLAVYLYNKKYVISDYGTITLESYYQSIFNMSPNVFSDYLRPLGPRQFLFLPKGAVQDTSAPQHPMLVLSVIDSNGTRYGNLFVYLDERQMQDEISSLINENLEYYLLDEEDRLILTNTEADTLYDKTLSDELQSNPHFHYLEGSLSGWKCYVGYPDALIQKQMLIQLALLLLAWIVIMLLGILLVRIICRKSYKPLEELATIVNGSKNTASSKEMEYETLKLAISSIFENKQLLEEQILIYKPILINSLLLELLESSQPNPAALNTLHNLGVSLPFSCTACVSLLASKARQDLLQHIAEQIRHQEIICLYVAYHKHSGTLIVHTPDISSCETALQKLTAILDETPSVQSWGIGTVVNSIEQLTLSYHQAADALLYLPLENDSRGAVWEDIEASGICGLSRPDNLKTLNAAFSAGRAFESKDCINAYFQAIVRNGYVQKAHLQFAREQMLRSISLACIDQSFQYDVSMLRSWTPEDSDSYQRLLELCLSACDDMEHSNQKRKEQLQQNSSNSIMDYLQAHLYDETLSLSRMAEVFDLSESTISRKIKTLTSYNFLDYVNQKRIEYACSLLTRTDLSVNEIARSSGYENDITFRRLFKKHIGITPGEYRRQEQK